MLLFGLRYQSVNILKWALTTCSFGTVANWTKIIDTKYISFTLISEYLYNNAVFQRYIFAYLLL
jgi:hypothetical protein